MRELDDEDSRPPLLDGVLDERANGRWGVLGEVEGYALVRDDSGGRVPLTIKPLSGEESGAERTSDAATLRLFD